MIGHERVSIFNLQQDEQLKHGGTDWFLLPAFRRYVVQLTNRNSDGLHPFRGGDRPCSETLTLKMLTRAGGKFSSGTYMQHTRTHTHTHTHARTMMQINSRAHHLLSMCYKKETAITSDQSAHIPWMSFCLLHTLCMISFIRSLHYHPQVEA